MFPSRGISWKGKNLERHLETWNDVLLKHQSNPVIPPGAKASLLMVHCLCAIFIPHQAPSEVERLFSLAFTMSTLRLYFRFNRVYSCYFFILLCYSLQITWLITAMNESVGCILYVSTVNHNIIILIITSYLYYQIQCLLTGWKSIFFSFPSLCRCCQVSGKRIKIHDLTSDASQKRIRQKWPGVYLQWSTA